MKKETAIKRIRKSVEETCKGEIQKVKDYFCDLIFLTYQSLELDHDEYYHTSSENLRFAIDVNLKDEYCQLIEEARHL